jgi:phosphoglucosamine mutase
LLKENLLKESPPGQPVRVLLGEDTRESSHWIAETLAAGLDGEKVEVQSAGVITTAGVAYLARTGRYQAGVMISASHNPYQDNGIKVFAHSGYKLADAVEHEVEQKLFDLNDHLPRSVERRVRLYPEATQRKRYLEFLVRLLPEGAGLGGLKMVLDCANGAASTLAPELFRRLGADVAVLNAEPDGRNINLGCGSMHPEGLQARVVREKAHLGVAFDGDADRALFVTAEGELVNGDGVLLLLARHLKRLGRLTKQRVVGTIMANLGLEMALKKEHISLLRTPVGDKYVIEEMLRTGAVLGGEQSGHIILREDHTTGDGLITALRVSQIVMESRQPLASLAAGLTEFPQIIRNVRVRSKPPLDKLPTVSPVVRKSQRELGKRGRVIVRYSGTETLVRIMVEAEDAGDVERHIAAIAAAVEKDLGP